MLRQLWARTSEYLLSMGSDAETRADQPMVEQDKAQRARKPRVRRANAKANNTEASR